MKKGIYTIAALSLAASAFAQLKVDILPLENSKVHFYQTADAMGDNSIIIEGDNNLLLLEPIPFFADMKGLNDYLKSLGKPLSGVIANYHPFGMSNYEGVDAYMPEPMIAFTASDVFAGLTANFKKGFGEENLDFTTPKNPKAIKVGETLSLCGAEIKFTAGAASDFPAFSVLIDNDVYYSHFAPAKKHISTFQVKSAADIDAVLADLENIKKSGAKHIISSHGGYIATQEDVDFQIEYLTKLKTFLTRTCDAGELGQMLLGAYPHIEGFENVRALAEALLPAKACPVKEEVRAAMNGYFKSVTACDADLIKQVWADEKASLINGRGHYFNEGEVSNFMTKAFADANNAVLSSISEHIVLLGEDAALVRLYWMWTETGKETGRGRETLVFHKIDDAWKLVHVHYSPLPAKK